MLKINTHAYYNYIILKVIISNPNYKYNHTYNQALKAVEITGWFVTALSYVAMQLLIAIPFAYNADLITSSMACMAQCTCKDCGFICDVATARKLESCMAMIKVTKAILRARR